MTLGSPLLSAIPGLRHAFFTREGGVSGGIYTSLNGGQPATLPRQQIIDAWAGVLGRLDATQHLVANHLVTVDGDSATCTAAFQATHLLATPHGGPIWTLGGHYRFQLARTMDGWRITGVQMVADWATGNQHIMTLAAEEQA